MVVEGVCRIKQYQACFMDCSCGLSQGLDLHVSSARKSLFINNIVQILKHFQLT